MSEVKPPPIIEGAAEDWQRILLYNQERYISGQQEIITVITQLLEQQRQMAAIANKAGTHLDLLGDQMQASIKSMGEFNRAIIKVPIVIVIVGAASWAFMYANEISEQTWLLIMAVAVFPYLGDSITAIAKLFGLARNQNGEKK